MVAPTGSRIALASAFAGAASRYWLGVFPLLSRELRHWHDRAREIPDPVLRRHALLTQKSERGNLEGAAAFAVLAPRAHRACVLRAVVAFQATYDYIDTLAEQPCADPVANGHQLHMALLAALEPDGEHADYYEHSAGARDDGYMRKLVDRCRFALRALPSYPSVADSALRCARRMVAYQALNHGENSEARGALAEWASNLTPADTGLRWWETAAAAASSLSVFALIAAGPRAGPGGRDRERLFSVDRRAAHPARQPDRPGRGRGDGPALSGRPLRLRRGSGGPHERDRNASDAGNRAGAPERRARDNPRRDDELLSVFPHGVGSGRIPGR